ncbi:hypothetical protein psyc5s11_44800 [Clostridium gelidum]|uniref:Uncharacterized protein n=1 Tax=Clostridium gelidum TaxID=704125 RepID=A0ABN6J558_9CLOT|nr:CD1375 family protein [Clostridium gelidum]BCZ48413.1 hypothetical protein psyc5s11_44800 [Clostridium gelidum]
MNLKPYLITAYAVLVRVEKWNLELVEGSTKKVVPEDYRTAVAEYLAE